MMRMAVVLIVTIVVMAMAAPQGHGLPDDQSPKAVENWFKQYFPNAKPKLTKLHFYLHNIVSKAPPASVPIAQASTTALSATRFGLVTVLDAPLTEKPDSKVFGYAQGTFTFSSQEELSTLMTVNFVFTAGKYNGSTLTILGVNQVPKKYREFPIIGGSGDFRMAQGIGTAMNYFVNATSGDDILEISFVFYRYPLPRHSVFHFDAAAAEETVDED